MSERRILLCWFIVSLGLAAVVSPYASRLPDGLEKTAQGLGLVQKENTLVRPPIPDYAWQGSVIGKLRASLAGPTGVVIVFAIVIFIGKILIAARVRRHRRG